MKKIVIIFLLMLFSPYLQAAITIKQEFSGIHGELLNNLVTNFKNNQQELSNVKNQDELQAYLSDSLSEIKNILSAYGFFKPSISVSKFTRGNMWVYRYSINPGPLLYFTHIDLRVIGPGLQDPAFQNVLAHFPLRQGDVALAKKYQEAKSSLVDLAAERGYFDAKLEESHILVDLQSYTATVIIHFSTGPRYFFGSVNFLPSPYAHCFLKRFVPFRFNEPYQTYKLVKLQENLGNSTFFEQVMVSPKPELAQGLLVPVEIQLVPRKAFQYSLGLGYGTDTGLRGLVGAHFRRLNPYGHTLDVLLQPSQKLNHYEASYSIPGRCPVTDLYRLSVAAENQHLETSGKSHYEKIELSHLSTIGCGWQQALSLSLRNEHSIPNNEPPVHSTMLLPSVNWSKIKADVPLNPNNGYQVSLNIRGATKALISNTNFIQATLQGKRLISLTRDTRFIAKGQIGYTLISHLDELPTSLQFYTGGAQTVRGYQYQAIGPGRSLLFASTELQQRIKGNLYGAIFFDTGSVSDGPFKEFKSGVGVGLVWRSPIGAIEVTLAQALNQPGHPRLIQFSMGPEL